MYRSALRSSASALRAARPTPTFLTPGSRRLLTTAPASKKRTWKGAGVRWGLAIAAVYAYNTTPLFSDDLPPQTGPAPPQFSDADLPTVEAVVEQKRRKAIAAGPPPPPAQQEPAQFEDPVQQDPNEPTGIDAVAIPSPNHEAESPAALEQEAASQGAFNPETGEINWDCQCLGGMADGPCGEEFKSAFSCFVYSTEEPKGMDCIDKFQHMQDCFRKYPEIYGSEIADDEDDDASAPAAVEGGEAALAKELPESTPAPATSASEPKQEKKEEWSDEVPKAAFDATKANDAKTQQ
ncbi:hypothetical protein B0T22DRAFT_161936 [Podospora appendiculata]|uniref:Mitochondrial intermembrane space import and assembly protein 40 n=1 Tax=Podospora appendiculata TaxID=314037 RepID=A0AAE0XA34_9PEZI|nr:hypothetical protein B0T22DRAFT_161936 [Podospora appendiculata]